MNEELASELEALQAKRLARVVNCGTFGIMPMGAGEGLR